MRTQIIHDNMLNAAILIYHKIGYICTDPLAEPESAAYGACSFYINGVSVKYRSAKITPTKTGQFVTLWKRSASGPIQPFDLSDPIDLIIIGVTNSRCMGQFIFPKIVLNEKGIVAGNGKNGKRAFRVYPPWDNATSRQALKTQQWQADYFLEVWKDRTSDLVRTKLLLSRK